MTLAKNLTVHRIRQWAWALSYGRGEEYFHQGLVSGLRERQGRITAAVNGTYSYWVALWERRYG